MSGVVLPYICETFSCSVFVVCAVFSAVSEGVHLEEGARIYEGVRLEGARL